MNEHLAAMLQEEEFLRNKLTVTAKDYGDAVESLLDLAMGDTSGSRAAAQLLLSTYNGYNYHMDLTDLCVLDLRYLDKALIVLRGRVLLGQEPHDAINDGENRFRVLEESWENLHTRRRYKKEDE